jgi:hypothetical protein
MRLRCGLSWESWPPSACDLAIGDESFNGRLQDECLKVEWFASLGDAQQKLAKFREHYNHQRPHSSLSDRTPAAFAEQMAALRLPASRHLHRGHKRRLAIQLGQRLRGGDVVRVLRRIWSQRCLPKVLFCDNGWSSPVRRWGLSKALSNRSQRRSPHAQ